jgi:hypothetical protein
MAEGSYNEELVQIDGMEEALKQISDLDSLKVNEYLRPYVKKAASVVSREYRKQIPSYLSITVRNGIVSKIYDNGIGSMKAVIGPRSWGYFLNGSRWGWTDRNGKARKEMPSTDQIADWVREKINPPESEVEQISFVIARHIAINGIPPQDVQKGVSDATREDVYQIIEAGISMMLEDLGNANPTTAV